MAIISEVRIGNFALAHIGTRSTIESLTEASAEAPVINLWYDYCRLEVLEAFDWTFARRRLTLSSLSLGLADGVWAYRYQYPSDCVAFRKIQNPLGDDVDAVPYTLEMNDDQTAKTILTNLDDAVGVYTFDQAITTFFSSHFVNTFSRLLAHRIAISLTAKKSIEKKQWEEYQSMLLTAPAHNANEEVAAPPREAEWIRGRIT